MKIVFFGTSEVGLPILDALSEEHEVVQVVTSPDAPVGRNQEITPSPISKFAVEHKLPLQKPATVKENPQFIEQLKTLDADIFVVVSYGKIMPLELLSVPRLKTVNVHFSLLPLYRGAAPIQYALLEGATETGTTIFILDEQIDHGPILAQAKLPIKTDDNFTTLAKKLADLSADLLIEILPDYDSGKLTPEEQNHEAATKTGLIKKEDGRINWTKTASDIYNQYRAYEAWPGIWTTWEGQNVKILECKPTGQIEEIEPGTIHDNVVACGGGSQLELITIQLAGSTPVPVGDFLKGHPEFSRGQVI